MNVGPHVAILLLGLWIADAMQVHCQAAIVYPIAPDGGRQIVFKNLDPQFLGVAASEDVKIADTPHREYFLAGLTNLGSGRLLSEAKLGGWRYLLLHGTNAVGVAELRADKRTGKAMRFNSLQRPGFASETLAALRKAESLPEVKQQDFEFRFLHVPAVHFVAVWLHGKTDDILIPLPPTFGRITAYQPYTENAVANFLSGDTTPEPQILGSEQVEAIWSEIWKSGNGKVEPPVIERLAEQRVVEQMTGNWTVLFGVTPDQLAIELRTNGQVEVSGEKEGTAWTKTGHWQVVSNKLVLFLKEDSLPSFIFRTHGQHYIFDPWAKTMMSELKREQP